MSYIVEADIAKQKQVASLTATESSLVAVLIPAVSSFAEKFTRRVFSKSNNHTDYFDGGQNHYFVANLPATNVTQVNTLKDFNPETWEQWGGTFRFDPVTGRVQLDGTTTAGYRTVRIIYTGGFIDITVPSAPVWDAGYEDLKQALVELVVAKLDQSKTGDKTVTEVDADGYREKYSIAQSDVPSDVMEVLGRYRHLA